MKLWALIGNETEITMDESQQGKKEFIVKTATIYWSFKNIIQDVNDSVENADSPATHVLKLSDGYWTFNDIQREFKDKEIKLIGNYHNGTCSLKPTGNNMTLGKFGVMLGFAEDKLFTKDVWHYSGKVNINHGLKYVKIMVDITAESNSVFDEKGKRSSIITTLPVETQQCLFSTRTVYNNINAKVPISSSFSSLRFSLSTNTKWPVDMEALLDIEIHWGKINVARNTELGRNSTGLFYQQGEQRILF